MRIFFAFLCLIFIFHYKVEAGNVSVVIIGGGPAGLATAIEAHHQGATVTIIEKRTSRSREQTLFLSDSSVELLEKWNVLPTHMKAIELPDSTKMGIVKINNLEEGLEQRVEELKIKRIFGEFVGFQGEGIKAVSIVSESKILSLPYDILVGADGAHSLVRNKSNIQCHRMGEVQATAAFVPFSQPLEAFDISEPIKTKEVFIRKITLPSTSIIFAQRIPGSQDVHKGISQQTFEEITRECNWSKEAKIIAENQAKFFDNITVILQQAALFSNEQKGVILVGDAAAVASFFQGMGANTAFKAAAIAGDFFRKIQQHEANAYHFFNQMMKETTDELINDSKFLFTLE